MEKIPANGAENRFCNELQLDLAIEYPKSLRSVPRSQLLKLHLKEVSPSLHMIKIWLVLPQKKCSEHAAPAAANELSVREWEFKKGLNFPSPILSLSLCFF